MEFRNKSNHDSVTLLGQSKGSASPNLEKYHSLMACCSHLGTWISPNDFPEYLACYDRDAQSMQARFPVLAFRPNSTAVIQDFVLACREKEISIQTRCGGSSFTGSSVPSQGSVCLVNSHLNKVLDYDAISGSIRVEPGITPHQIDRLFNKDGWQCPLEMKSGGIAGLAGSLCSGAKGYHQCHWSIWDCISILKMIDGSGLILDVPSYLVCGTEGSLGVIIEMTVHLKRKSSVRRWLKGRLHLEAISGHSPKLKNLKALKSIVAYEGEAYFLLEGERWRVDPTHLALNAIFPEVLTPDPINFPSPFFKKPISSPLYLSCTVGADQLLSVIQKIEILAQTMQISLSYWVELCGASLHFQLDSCHEKIKDFLCEWTNILFDHKGFLISAHGIGTVLLSYLPPFIKKESQFFYSQVQNAFDPDRLLSRDRLIPIPGKCLERVSVYE